MKTVKFQLEPLTCPSCIKKIEGALKRMQGVEEAKVLFHSSKVKVRFDAGTLTADTMQKTIEKLGYPVLKKQVA